MEEAAEASDKEGEEARAPRCARDPLQPTKAEWEAHQATHLPLPELVPVLRRGAV